MIEVELFVAVLGALRISIEVRDAQALCAKTSTRSLPDLWKPVAYSARSQPASL